MFTMLTISMMDDQYLMALSRSRRGVLPIY